MTTLRSPKIMQVSADLDEELGGPVSVVIESSKRLRNYFDHELIVIGQHVKVEEFEVTWHFKSLFSNLYGIPRNIFKYIFAIRKSNADIVITHGFYMFSTLIAIYFAQGHVLVMPHGSLEAYQRHNSRNLKRIFNLLVRIRIRRGSTSFIVASKAEIEGVRKEFPGSRIRVVGLGVNAGLFETFKQNQNSHERIFRILSISRIARKKRIDLAIKALAILNKIETTRSYELLIAGTGDRDLQESLANLVKIENLSESVKFLGWVGGSKRSVYAMSKCFILISENENFAVAAAESVVCLKPVIVSRYVAFSEFVERTGVGVVIDDMEPANIAQAVLLIEAHYDLFTERCTAWRSELSWDNVIVTWCNVIDEVIRF